MFLVLNYVIMSEGLLAAIETMGDMQWMAGTEAPVFQELGPYSFLVSPLSDLVLCTQGTYLELQNQNSGHAVQVSEYRYNVKFAADYASVSYTNHNFQQFAPADSCSTCSLDDLFVGINRCVSMWCCRGVLFRSALCTGFCLAGSQHSYQLCSYALLYAQCECALCRAYLAVIASNGGLEANLLISSVPLTLNFIIGNIATAFVQVRCLQSKYFIDVLNNVMLLHVTHLSWLIE